MIICETISTANEIGFHLSRIFKSSLIHYYTNNNSSTSIFKKIEKINPSNILVATNLAGRGTDINSQKIEEFGGLHVIITFFPINTRVLTQNYGRTARKGNKGTAEIIAYWKD